MSCVAPTLVVRIFFFFNFNCPFFLIFLSSFSQPSSIGRRLSISHPNRDSLCSIPNTHAHASHLRKKKKKKGRRPFFFLTFTFLLLSTYVKVTLHSFLLFKQSGFFSFLWRQTRVHKRRQGLVLFFFFLCFLYRHACRSFAYTCSIEYTCVLYRSWWPPSPQRVSSGFLSLLFLSIFWYGSSSQALFY